MRRRVISRFAAASRIFPRPAVIGGILACLALGAIHSLDAGQERANSGGMPPRTAGYLSVTPAITLSHMSPVEYFRGLLGMTPAQRERALAGKLPEDKKAILDKIREYEAMPREVREARLRRTDLQWRLIGLIRLDPAERERQLKDVSPMDLPMIQAPLVQWDALPETTRKALLENEQYIQTYAQWQVSSPADQAEILERLPASRRAFFEVQLKRWEALPEDQQAELRGQFQRVFLMSNPGQPRTVGTLSETDRQQMEQARKAYAGLPAEQRQRCLDSFAKFMAMEPGERAQFLQNAEKWEGMNAYERKLWRKLVGELPPMPPPPPGMPPMPPGFWDARPGPGVVAR